MADDLSWLNQHALLQLHPYVSEVVAQEQLKLTTQQRKLAQRYPLSMDYLTYLKEHGEYKDACTFMAYNLHRRVAVWWGYVCVVDVICEILQKPAPELNLDDVAKPKPMQLPSFVSKMQQQATQKYELDPQLLEQLAAAQDQLHQVEQQLRQFIPAQFFDFVDEVVAEQNAAFKSLQGQEPMELLQSLVDQALALEAQEQRTGMSSRIDPNSPIFTASKELEEKIEKVRQDTIALVKAALPAVDTEQQNQDRMACLDAVFAYLAAPDEVNAQRLLDLGNQIPDQLEGLLSLVGFWSFGDLMPQGKQVIPTPAGLMSNGLNCLLLSCALKKGGTFNFAQRFERYFNFGYDCLLGKSDLAHYVAQGTSLHEERFAQMMQLLGLAPTQDSPHVAAAHAAAAQAASAATTTAGASSAPAPQAHVGAPASAATQANAASQSQAATSEINAGATSGCANNNPGASTIQAELFSNLQRLQQQIDQMIGANPSTTAATQTKSSGAPNSASQGATLGERAPDSDAAPRNIRFRG